MPLEVDGEGSEILTGTYTWPRLSVLFNLLDIRVRSSPKFVVG